MRDLHWLPIQQRILFKLAMIIFKSLHGLAQSYLDDDCVLASAAAGRRHLRSADTMKPLVRRLGLSSAPETLQFRPQPFGTVCQQLWDCFSAQFRHLRGNWKLSTPARRCSTSEDHLFCALQMQSLLLLFYYYYYWIKINRGCLFGHEPPAAAKRFYLLYRMPECTYWTIIHDLCMKKWVI